MGRLLHVAAPSLTCVGDQLSRATTLITTRKDDDAIHLCIMRLIKEK
jgi:hypothetical protein